MNLPPHAVCGLRTLLEGAMGPHKKSIRLRLGVQALNFEDENEAEKDGER